MAEPGPQIIAVCTRNPKSAIHRGGTLVVEFSDQGWDFVPITLTPQGILVGRDMGEYIVEDPPCTEPLHDLQIVPFSECNISVAFERSAYKRGAEA